MPAATHAEPGLLLLPESALCEICALCDLPTRVAVLPLVCRALHRLLAAPSAVLWPEVSFEGDIVTPPQIERARCFLAWLRVRGAGARSMELDFWTAGVPPQATPPLMALQEQMQETLAATLGACEFLRMRWGGVELEVDDWVASATAVTCLALSAHHMSVYAPLASLSTLVHLELSTVSDSGPQLDPAGCLPPSLTRLCCVPAPAPGEGAPGQPIASSIPEQVLALPALVYLDASESLFERAHLSSALPRLTRLSSLALDKCEIHGGFPSELSLLTSLRILSFDGCICHEPPQQHGSTLWAVLARLTGLQSLSLSNCNLHELPPAVVALPRLQYLYAEHNEIRALPPGPYLKRLSILSTDWEALLRSHRTVLGGAPHLRLLALGSQSIFTTNADALPPLATAAELCHSLRSSPALRDLLLVARPGHVHGAMKLVLEIMLSLRGLRPDLSVRPIEHTDFFVEEPSPDKDEEAAAAAADPTPMLP